MNQLQEFARNKRAWEERLYARDECGQMRPWLVFISRREGTQSVYDSWTTEQPLPRIGERVKCCLGSGETEATWLDHVVTDIVHWLHPVNPAIWVYVRPRRWYERLADAISWSRGPRAAAA